MMRSVYVSLRSIKLFVLYLARGGYYHQLGHLEGLEKTSVAKCLHDVMCLPVSSCWYKVCHVI